MQLPIDQMEEEFHQLLRSQPVDRIVVLTAPTGSGKSTRVPVWCYQAESQKSVLVIEPRRIACRTLAGWVSRGFQEPVGQTVGYTVRFEQKCSERTRILFVTPGVARRMLVEEQLQEFGTIVFDEFHERSWETDALLALLAARDRRARLLVMSATLAAEQLTERYDGRRLDATGRTYPVEVSYREGDAELTVPSSRGLAERTARVVRECWQRHEDGSILVFLPGLGAMRDVEQRLAGLPVYLLHGTFSHAEQDRAFSEERRVVLATNVAESSLTVPGVTTVIDSGLERRPIHQSGYVALATVPIAQSSAEQRAGRAGRTAPGRAVRLWDERARLEALRPPDLERMELDDLVLFLSALPNGLDTPAEWLREPPEFAWQRALERLRESGLVDNKGKSTELGRAVLHLPVEHDWGRLLVRAPEELRGDLCDLCALAAARRNPFRTGVPKEVEEVRKKDLGENPWGRALNLVRVGKPGPHGLHDDSLREVRRVADELRGLTSAGSRKSSSDKPHPDLEAFMAGQWPRRQFVRRTNRAAWGNGTVECRLARGEELSEDCQAATFLQVQPVLGRGLKVELQGRWALPVRLSVLHEAGLGAPEFTKIRWENGALKARTHWVYGGRTLAKGDEILMGEALRRALVELMSEGRWRPQVRDQMEEQIYYDRLRAHLEGEPNAAKEWTDMLLGRLRELGVNSSEELPLVEDEDLHLHLVTDLELEDLKKAYPATYTYGGSHYEMEYLPLRRRVIMHQRFGKKAHRPKPQHLPRWNGWKVETDEKGRRTVLRA